MVKQGYKPTEIGVIPEDWEVKELGEIVTAYKLGGNYKTKQNVNDFPLIKMGNIGRGFIVTDKLEYVNESYNVGDVLKYGDLLFNTRNTLELVGKVAIWRNELPFALYNSNLLKIEFQNKYVSSNFYMNYIFNDRRIIKQLSDIATGTTSVAAIYTRDLFGIKIPLPPLVEQEAIASALSDADAWIDSLEQLIAKKRLIKQGAMQSLLIPPSEELVLSGVEAWEVKKLGEVAEIIMGQSPLSENYNQNGVGLPLVQGNADIDNRKTIIRNYTSQITKKGKMGDIIMSVRAPVGEIAKATFECCLGRGVCAIRAKNDYLYHYLIFSENNWGQFSTGSTFDSVNSNQVNDFSIVLPKSLSEQERIATILSDMDAELEALATQLGKARQIKQGMMQELLTGRVRLV